jgi:hypothetical protein
MNVPPWAGFVADFPDDEVEDEGDIQVYGGRNVALALGEIFTGLNCTRVSAPESAGEQGWEFDFYFEGRHRFWCRVQSFHPVFWLLLDDLSATPKGAAAYVELWRKLGNALERHPRFHKIIWRSFRDGPPDWAEVEAASDPPDQNFDEIFALTEFRQAAPKPGCLSIFFGGPLVFWGIIGTTQYALFDTSNDRRDMMTFSVTFLLVGLLILFWSRMRWWIDSLRS